MQTPRIDTRRPPARATRRPARGLLLGLSLAASIATAGCTTFVTPEEGGAGAFFTLVTVDHVAERERALRDELGDTIATQVAEAVEAAREADRARLEEFTARIEAHAEELAALSQQLNESTETTLQLARSVKGRLDAVALESAALRDEARRLETEIGVMPLQTLDRLRRAIGDHLDREVPNPASAPDANPAPTSGAAPAGSARRQPFTQPAGPARVQPAPPPVVEAVGPRT